MDEYKVKQEEEISIDLNEVFSNFWKGLKKFWLPVLILCSFTTAASCVKAAVNYLPMYESKVSFTVSTKMGYDETNTSYGFYYNQSTAEQLADVFPYILHSDIMNEMIQEELGPGATAGSVNVNAIPKSNLFIMEAKGSDPLYVRDLLKVTLKHLPDVTKYVIGDTKLNIIQPVTTPEQPYNTLNYRKSGVKGMIFGGIISGLILLMYALFHKTIRKEDDFREILNIKCLGTVPQVRFKMHKKQIDCTVSVLNKRIDNCFRESVRSIALRVQRKMDEKNQKVLLVTSTLSDEGKSMMALNLALALQERGKKVLLMDMDFRNPTIAKHLGLNNFVRLSDVLMEKNTIENGVFESEQGIYFMGNKEPEEKVISLLVRPVLKQIIEQSKKEMDYIIIDTPPCGIVSDSVMLSDVCDGILYVVRQDQVKHSQAINAIQTVVGRGLPVVGGVLNGVDRSTLGYGYYEKYAYRKYGYRKYGEYRNK